MIDSRLRNCTSVEEAAAQTGKTPLQIRNHLKRHGIETQTTTRMLASVQVENYDVEVLLEEEI